MRGAEDGRPVAIVIGAGEMGSAIALALHRAGGAVVLTDEVDPAWTRRGMAFTNAWYLGNAELDGEAAVFCASLRSLPSVLDRRRAIAATSWSWAGVAAALAPAVVVDATLRGSQLMRGSREAAPALTIAILEAPAAIHGVDVVIESPPALDAAGAASCTVHAPRGGRFATSRRIGDRVVAGEVVGGVGAIPVAAPCDGVLRGLPARGARLAEGAPVVEVDPRGDPVLCFGLYARAVAAGCEVVRSARQRGALPAGALVPSTTGATMGG